VLRCTRLYSAVLSRVQLWSLSLAPRAALKTLHSLPATEVGVLLHGVSLAPRAALKTLHSLLATDVGVLLHGVGPIRRAARRIARQAAAARARHEAASAVAAAGARHRKLLLVRRLSATAPAVRGAAGARRLAGGLGLDPPRHVAAEGDGRTAAPRARARLQLAQAQGGVTFVCALFFVVLWVVSTCHAHGARAPASALRGSPSKGCGCWVDGNRGTRPTSPQTVPRLAVKTTATRPRLMCV